MLLQLTSDAQTLDHDYSSLRCVNWILVLQPWQCFGLVNWSCEMCETKTMSEKLILILIEQTI